MTEQIPSMLFEKRPRCEDCFESITPEQIQRELTGEQIDAIITQRAVVRTDRAVYRRRTPDAAAVRDWAKQS